MREGSWPLTRLKREGAHSGLLQYAESKVTPWAASLDKCGICITDAGSCSGSRGAAIWSAMMNKMSGRLAGPVAWGVVGMVLACICVVKGAMLLVLAASLRHFVVTVHLHAPCRTYRLALAVHRRQLYPGP